MTNHDSSNVERRAARSAAWRWVQAIFLIAAFAWFARTISRNWNEYRHSVSTIDADWSAILLATAIVFATYAILIQSWRLLINGAGSSLHYLRAVRIWTIANLGRYIPGKVASIAALGVLARQEGVSTTAAASAAILGTLINIGAGFGIVAITGSRVLSALGEWYSRVAVAGSLAFVGGVVALPWILPRVAAYVAKKTGRKDVDFRIRTANLWAAVTINTVSWFSYGLAFMVFSKALLPGLSGDVLQFVVVWAASYLAGYLAFFAVGGIGVREVAMATGLTTLGMTDAAGAAIIAITSRLWLSVLELLPGLVALALTPALSKSLRHGRD